MIIEILDTIYFICQLAFKIFGVIIVLNAHFVGACSLVQTCFDAFSSKLSIYVSIRS